jgi:hypothetical protein
MRLIVEIDYSGVLRTRATGAREDDPVEGAQFFKALEPEIEKLDQLAKTFVRKVDKK